MQMGKLKYYIIALLTIALIGGGFLLFKNHNKPESVGVKTETKSEYNAKSASPKIVEKKEVKILFLGDVMLDRYIREVAMKKGNDFILEKVKDLLNSNDLVVANLEGPITDKNSISIGTVVGQKGHFSFTFHPSWAKTLSQDNIKLVSLGNNHILNFDNDGVEQTEKYLTEAGIGYFGAPGGENLRYKIKELNGLKIGFVSYNQFELEAVDKTLADIEAVKKQADLVIIYTHWGKEYETSILPNIRMLGQQFIDAGADLIIGSHPHVIEASEEYKGKKIYYSLGNFIFDQYFSPQTTEGLAVRVIISPDKKLNFQEYQVKLKNNGQTEITN
jgi:poly-gamma-glutamate synthesis protein (capsule biosynthesis protein)